ASESESLDISVLCFFLGELLLLPLLCESESCEITILSCFIESPLELDIRCGVHHPVLFCRLLDIELAEEMSPGVSGVAFGVPLPLVFHPSPPAKMSSMH